MVPARQAIARIDFAMTGCAVSVQNGHFLLKREIIGAAGFGVCPDIDLVQGSIARSVE
jgi:hypothetical protein